MYSETLRAQSRFTRHGTVRLETPRAKRPCVFAAVHVERQPSEEDLERHQVRAIHSRTTTGRPSRSLTDGAPGADII
eukprot:scaffold6871_cov75-Phaeocystis_antarctica.AAC.5